MTQYMRVQCSRGTEGLLTKYTTCNFFLVCKLLVAQFVTPPEKKKKYMAYNAILHIIYISTYKSKWTILQNTQYLQLNLRSLWKMPHLLSLPSQSVKTTTCCVEWHPKTHCCGMTVKTHLKGKVKY